MHRTVLDDNGQAALQRYIDKGGNFVAIHAASDCLRNSTFIQNELGKLWKPYYSNLAYVGCHDEGAHFDYHPEIQNAVSLPHTLGYVELVTHVLQDHRRRRAVAP